MGNETNVGKLDQIIRIILGLITLGTIIYWATVEPIFHWGFLIPLVILVPFFLKTGITRICPVMKSLGISTNK